MSKSVIIIGAGVVGLACGRELSSKGYEVFIAEQEQHIATQTSARNSGVIHAGIYYDAGTMKAKLCAKGNRALYAYCEKKNIPHLNVGKFVVATSKDEASKLESIYNKAAENNVVGISRVSKEYVNNKEPLVICHEALEVKSTGIVDQQSLMRSYIGDFEDNGGMIAYNTKIESIESIGDKFKIITNDKTEIIANSIINSAGLEAHNIAKLINGFNQKFIPKIYYAKGNYFETNKKLGIKPVSYTHLTLPTKA